MSIAATVVLLPATTGAQPTVASAAASTTVRVSATEFRYKLSTSTVPRGVVTFKVRNAGHSPHDFKIAGKKTKLLNPGASTTLRVTLTKRGRVRYLCTVAGHAQAGMKGVLTVK
jgi:uncharacterized cupredoxin-like copper-binding protein